MRQPIYTEDAIARGYGLVMNPGVPWRNQAYGWDQILTSAKGSFQLSSADAVWRVSPGQALLIPAENAHQITMIERCDFRAVFVIGLDLGSFRLVSLTPLLRETLFEISSLGALSRNDERDRSLLSLAMHDLRLAPSIPLKAIWPVSTELQEAARLLTRNDLDPCTVGEAATRINLSQRTLERRFQNEVGMGVAEWRREHQLLKSAQSILNGDLVSEVALDAGYSTISAFGFAFSRKFGLPPSKFKSRYQA